MEAGYRRLVIWEKSDDLAFQVYKATVSFPKSELYGITSQIRRAALSVPTNIVEGYARNSKKEFGRFIAIALGSLAELKYLVSFANRLDYLSKAQYEVLINLAEEVNRILWKFYQSLK